MSEPSGLLLGDIGGSNARFALAESVNLRFLQSCLVPYANYASLELALAEFLNAHEAVPPAAICMVAAGTLQNQHILLNHNHWVADSQSLSQRFGGIPVRLLNDFAAFAWSIPALQRHDLDTVG